MKAPRYVLDKKYNYLESAGNIIYKELWLVHVHERLGPRMPYLWTYEGTVCRPIWPSACSGVSSGCRGSMIFRGDTWRGFPSIARCSPPWAAWGLRVAPSGRLGRCHTGCSWPDWSFGYWLGVVDVFHPVFFFF